MVGSLLVLTACGSDEAPTATSVSAGGGPATTNSTGLASGATSTTPADDGLFPDVVAAEAVRDDDGTWRFDVTLSSPYDQPDRYADAWRVLDVDGVELGVRVLTHDHANEQPFTRSLSGVEIPDDVTEVTIEGRDQRNGWGGTTVTVDLSTS